jgi:hypothetical protein
MRRCSLVVAALVLSASALSAQKKSGSAPSGKFREGSFFGGPSVTLGNVGGAGAGIGGEFEYGAARLTGMGNGMLGFGFRLHTWSQSYFTTTTRVTPIALSANYHFVVTDPRFDPYAGLALGYTSWSVNNGIGQQFSGNSGSFFMFDGGLRFAMAPNMALQGGISVGSNSSVGLLRIAAMFHTR